MFEDFYIVPKTGYHHGGLDNTTHNTCRPCKALFIGGTPLAYMIWQF